MRNCSKLVLEALAAALVLGAAISTASANRLATSNQLFRATWSETRPLRFGGIIECPVTIEGSFHSRTFSKTPEQLVGYVTRAFVASEKCTNGQARILTESLPWHGRYDSFQGALPSITTINIRLINVAFQVFTVITGSCLYRTTATSPARGVMNRNTTTGVISDLTPDPNASIPKVSGGSFCPNPGAFEGETSSVTVLGATTAITVTLVA